MIVWCVEWQNYVDPGGGLWKVFATEEGAKAEVERMSKNDTRSGRSGMSYFYLDYGVEE